MKKKFKLSKYIKHLSEEDQDYIKGLLTEDIGEYSIERMACSGEFKEFDEEEHTSTGYGSTRYIDFSGDVVVPNGINLTVFDKNPIIFYNHNSKDLPIGKALSTEIDDIGLKLDIKYAVEENQEAETVYKLVKGGYIKQHSIGFVPLEAYRRGSPAFDVENAKLKLMWPDYSGEADQIIVRSLLLEVSIVNIADNQDSVVISVKQLEEDIEISDVDIENAKKLNIVDKTMIEIAIDKTMREIEIDKSMREVILKEAEEHSYDINKAIKDEAIKRAYTMVGKLYRG